MSLISKLLRLFLSLSLCLTVALSTSTNAWAAATHHKAAKPIVDGQGRTRVIVDFTEEAYLSYPRDLLINFDPKKDTQQPQALALIKEYEQRFGFVREGLTTWVGASVTAFLTTRQVEQLLADRNVRLITDDEYQQFSAPATPPTWYPSWTASAWGELNDWGRTAVNGKTVLAGSGRKVYIIDSGVADHNDLSSVSQRVNVNCGTGGDCSGVAVYSSVVAPPYLGAYPTVGCYAHATHIAGIVGASPNGMAPRTGVYAGVNMVSIALASTKGAYNNAWIPCADGSLVSSVGFAFDFIAAQNQPTGILGGITNIATMSINGGKLGFAGGAVETNRTKLLTMVNPATVWRYRQGLWEQWYYPGIFFTQSAGNQNRNACLQLGGESAAFQIAPSPTGTAVDGIMVVGAIRQNGTAASSISDPVPPASNLTQPEPRIFRVDPVPVGGFPDPLEPGSNYGNCVDIWAPGDAIYSTWGSGQKATYATGSYSGGQPSNYGLGTLPGNPTVPYSGPPPSGLFGWQWLSGTSMAAPHVAAAAAYMADKYTLSTPAAIEQQVRDNWKTWGAVDPLNTSQNPLPIRIVYLPD
jgi:subtilisin family serine protease